MAKKIIYFICFLSFILIPVSGQHLIDPSASNSDRQEGSPPSKDGDLAVQDSALQGSSVGYWQIHGDNLDTFNIAVDTALHAFHNYNPIYKHSIANNYLGNLGSPYQSDIYFDRPEVDFFFSDVYDLYIKKPETMPIVNTRTPFSLLSYGTGGSKQYAEETLSFIFSQNVNKSLNVGGYYDMIYARSQYHSYDLATRHKNYGAFASYMRPKYNLFFNIGTARLENYESGGIGSDDEWIDDYINNPLEVTDARGAKQPENYPSRMSDTRSYMKNDFMAFKHKYNIGVLREVETEDSTEQQFVSALNIVHQFKYETHIKLYDDADAVTSYYDTAYINSSNSLDSLRQRKISNRIGLYLDEDINQFGKFGAGAYIQMDNYYVSNMPWTTVDDTLLQKSYSEMAGVNDNVLDSSRLDYINAYDPYRYTNVIFGGSIFKRTGTHFFFDASGNICLSGYNAGDWQLKGQLQQVFPNMGDWELSARANFQRKMPDYIMQHYHSNNFWWDNSFDATFKQQIGGTLKIPGINFEASIDIDNMQNYTYFDQYGLPAQFDNNLAVMAIGLKKDFEIGNHLVWENEVVYQETSSDIALPLPELSVYTNLYFKNVLFQVLHFEIGADCRYNTAYAAPGYMPATGRFYNQQDVTIGNYPHMNAYANFFLRRMRFFVMYQHVNFGWPSLEYFSAPHYGYNHRMLKIGLQWSFYD